MNNMYLKEIISTIDLAECFKSIFPAKNVMFSNKLEDIENWNKDGLYIVKNKIYGDFPLYLEIYPESNESDVSLALKISSFLQIDILVSDDSLNPYSWLLCSNNEVENVFVDTNFLDENEGFIIKC